MNRKIDNSVYAVLICCLTGMLASAGYSRTKQYGVSSTQLPDSKTAPIAKVAEQKLYYENTIKGVIASDCARCHSGPVRNLTDYDSLKVYAENGMLMAMVSPGGPMNRFAGGDAQAIVDWLKHGAPEKAGVTQAGFFKLPGASARNNCVPGFQHAPFRLSVPLNTITYSNTLKFILARDCMECHSGRFRNLTTYDNVKYYSDNGLMAVLVQPGGQMHRFAGPDSQYILYWIKNGAAR